MHAATAMVGPRSWDEAAIKQASSPLSALQVSGRPYVLL